MNFRRFQSGPIQSVAGKKSCICGGSGTHQRCMIRAQIRYMKMYTSFMNLHGSELDLRIVFPPILIGVGFVEVAV